MDGYEFRPGREVLATTGIADDFEAFALGWDHLPADPYLTSAPPYRFRRHARFLLSEEGVVAVEPPGDYLQAATHNPLFGGVPRRFAPVTWDKPNRRVLTSLARLGVDEVLGMNGPVRVNVHLIRIIGGTGHAGTPVPEGRHRDGFAFISIHLIGRDVDGGGETRLVDDAGGRDVTLTLADPMDSLYIDDRRYTHDTTAIEGRHRTVRRDVLLMSFDQAEPETPLS